VKEAWRVKATGDSTIMQSSSSGSSPGVGDVISIEVQKAPLSGMGDMSIMSLPIGTGDDEGIKGGVVTYSSGRISACWYIFSM
jgi:hypothetical protein